MKVYKSIFYVLVACLFSLSASAQTYAELHEQAAVAVEEGRYADCLDLMTKARTTIEAETKIDSSDYMGILYDMFMLYMELEQIDMALEPLAKVKDLVAAREGTQNENYYNLLENHTVLLLDMGRYSEAKQDFTRLIDLSKLLRKDTSNQHIALLNSLGQQHFNEGEYADALRLHNDSEKLVKQKFTNQSIEYAVVAQNLAVTHDMMKNYTEAEKQYKVCLALFDKFKDKVSVIQRINFLVTYGGMQIKNKKLDVAQTLLTEAEGLVRNVLSPNSFTTGKLAAELGNLNFNRQKYADAINYYTEAENFMLDAIGGYQHEQFVEIWQYKAMAYEASNDTLQAELHYEKALSSCAKMMGQQSAKYAEIVKAYVAMLEKTKQLDKAILAKELYLAN
jgi:tetratricopeptide (TPR) repeat protein